ncbi:protein unc-13 homolog A [Striga asiatica]|uniref:Protein unc-13 homolog A n=1 Tax=Striga asiatica TaxID=4170 RepID=A0A5A7QXT0_STRAF|nr:protein unc-13 homolog A [Striga asiatica]
MRNSTVTGRLRFRRRRNRKPAEEERDGDGTASIPSEQNTGELSSTVDHPRSGQRELRRRSWSLALPHSKHSSPAAAIGKFSRVVPPCSRRKSPSETNHAISSTSSSNCLNGIPARTGGGGHWAETTKTPKSPEIQIRDKVGPSKLKVKNDEIDNRRGVSRENNGREVHRRLGRDYRRPEIHQLV